METITLDLCNRMLSDQWPNRIVTNACDTLGRVTVSTVSPDSVSGTVTKTYDQNSNVSSINSSQRLLTYTYDPRDQVIMFGQQGALVFSVPSAFDEEESPHADERYLPLEEWERILEPFQIESIESEAAGRLPEALAQYETALRIFPDYVPSLQRAIDVLVAMRRFDDARAVAARLEPPQQ